MFIDQYKRLSRDQYGFTTNEHSIAIISAIFGAFWKVLKELCVVLSCILNFITGPGSNLNSSEDQKCVEFAISLLAFNLFLVLVKEPYVIT